MPTGAQELSEYLRHGDDWLLWCRRGVVLTSLTAALCMMFIGLYQMGIIRHLPEPPLPRMQADVVDAAPSAYRPLSLPMPDAFLGLVSYGVTAALAVMGGAERHKSLGLLPLALGAKVLVDAVQAARLTRLQWVDHRAFCFWCLTAALATFASVVLAAPEVVVTVKRLLGK